ATVLEEMPPFPERESSILAKLKKKKQEKTGIIEKEEKSEPVEKPTTNGQVPVAINETPAPNPALQPDLLGTETTVSKPVTNNFGPPETGGGGLLVDVFEMPATPVAGSAPSITQGAEENIKKFVCKNTGVLFETDILQVGIKSEFKDEKGALGVFYGNKTSSQFVSFSSMVHLPGDLNTHILSVNGMSQRIVLPLPLFPSKFFAPTEMNSQDFFSRWKQLGNPDQECQQIFKAKFSIDTETISTKLVGFGMSLLQNVDPNPENFVCAGIIKGSSVQIGTLLRLEPNRQAQMFRLTIRSSKPHVATTLVELLVDQF
ncbi:AP-2 complex subunit alpha-2, partial [Stylophora pistillata]